MDTMCFLSSTLWKGGSWVILSILAFHIVIVPSHLQSHEKRYVQAAVIFTIVTHSKHLKECHQERVGGSLCNLGLGKSECHGTGLVAGAGFSKNFVASGPFTNFFKVELFCSPMHPTQPTQKRLCCPRCLNLSSLRVQICINNTVPNFSASGF